MFTYENESNKGFFEHESQDEISKCEEVSCKEVTADLKAVWTGEELQCDGMQQKYSLKSAQAACGENSGSRDSLQIAEVVSANSLNNTVKEMAVSVPISGARAAAFGCIVSSAKASGNALFEHVIATLKKIEQKKVVSDNNSNSSSSKRSDNNEDVPLKPSDADVNPDKKPDSPVNPDNNDPDEKPNNSNEPDVPEKSCEPGDTGKQGEKNNVGVSLKTILVLTFSSLLISYLFPAGFVVAIIHEQETTHHRFEVNPVIGSTKGWRKFVKAPLLPLVFFSSKKKVLDVKPSLKSSNLNKKEY